jgi:predicted ribosomally synthesized peptide with nif11-like leader
MTIVSAKTFIDQLEADPTLRGELSAQVGDVTKISGEDRASGEALVSFGTSHGYDFTLPEIRDAYKGFLETQMASAGRELTDTELETVSGGSGCCLTSVDLQVSA